MDANARLSTSKNALFYFALALLLFTVSGYCGLLYQVVWTRKLVLLLGTTSYAVSTVLSIFFLGLAFGSLWGGRIADRTKNHLRLYGFFEIIIGLWAVFFLVAVNAGEELIINLLGAAEVSRMAGVLVRAVLSAVLLFIPVFLMGATLPILSKFVNQEIKVQGNRIALLYSLNTIGAVLGCFSTGFYLLPNLGYTASTWVGAGLNIGIGILALVFSTKELNATQIVEATYPSLEKMQNKSDGDVASTWVIGAFAVSGFCAIALEVLWTRLLTIVFLGTTYAFTTMLSTMLLGIALGSAVAALFVDRTRAWVGLFGVVMMFIGVSCVFQLGWIAGLPERVNELQFESGDQWSKLITGKVLLSFLVLFPPSFGFGMTFPLVVKAVGQSPIRLGKDIGRVYFANTLSGTFGALAGGYLILPLLGTHWGMILLAAILIVTGFILLILCPSLNPRIKGPIPAIVLLLLGMAWRSAPADVNQALNTGYVPADHRVIHYREGVEGTITVSEPKDDTSGSNRVLFINRVQATTTIERGVKMNRFQGALPLLFNRDPKHALFICLGSGITCGTLALHNFDRIDAVEISEDVLNAAPLFEADNLGVLQRPNVRFHINDGRNYLMCSQERYDLISFEPMPLALAGVSTFYSVEYYRECLEHLTPGGMVSQWVPFHSLNPQIVRSLVHTFASVFPEYCAFFVNADLFLIGSNEKLQIDFNQFAMRFEQPELKSALQRAGFADAMEVATTFVMDKAGLDAFAEGGDLLSDDLPWAEFEAPKLVYAHEVPETVRQMQPHLTGIDKILQVDSASSGDQESLVTRQLSHFNDFEGLRIYYGGMLLGDAAANSFIRSLEMDSGNINARYYLKDIALRQGETLIRWEKFEEVNELLDAALKFMPEDKDLLELKKKLQEKETAR